MTVYRRLARSKKGMSTIFGGLFFVIIILMGFNVMLWGFIQYDAYNHVITSMSQRDQQATSENLVPVNVTCNSTCPTGSGTLTVIVNNLGGSSVTIANVYISNTNNTGSCRPTPCVTNPSGTSGNIPAGATNFLVRVPLSVPIVSSSSYRISLATTRGRLFNLYYPWRFNSLIINGGGGGNFVTNIGPLAVYLTSNHSTTLKAPRPYPSQPSACPMQPPSFSISDSQTPPLTAMLLYYHERESKRKPMALTVSGSSPVRGSWPLTASILRPTSRTIPPRDIFFNQPAPTVLFLPVLP